MRGSLITPRACRALIGIGFMLTASARTAAAQCFSCGYDELGGFCRTALTGSASCNTIGIIFTECHLGSGSCGWAAVEMGPDGRGRLLADAILRSPWTSFGLGAVRRACGGIIVDRRLEAAESAQMRQSMQTLLL